VLTPGLLLLAAEGQGPPELPGLFSVIVEALKAPIEKALGLLPFPVKFEAAEFAIFFVLIIIFLFVFIRVALLGRSIRPTSKLYLLFEVFADYLKDLFGGILGPAEIDKYLPFVGTIFIYILTMNLAGIFLLMRSPTSSFSTNFGIAVCVFLYVQFTGIRRSGLLGYLGHFVGEPWWLFPLNLPIHIIEEFIKPLTLSLRLFGNVFGEDILLGAFSLLVPFIPLHSPLLFLALLTSIVQAGIFSLLTAVYILLLLPHEDHSAEHAAQTEHTPA
jgi:F-type H+-transporting ATPase subunit a